MINIGKIFLPMLTGQQILWGFQSWHIPSVCWDRPPMPRMFAFDVMLHVMGYFVHRLDTQWHIRIWQLDNFVHLCRIEIFNMMLTHNWPSNVEPLVEHLRVTKHILPVQLALGISLHRGQSLAVIFSYKLFFTQGIQINFQYLVT